MCLTETWLTANDESLMPALIPAGYGFRHLPRSDRRGGGVGVMFKSSFQVSKSMPWLAESFECLQLVLTGANVASTLRIFIIYRPPSSGRNSAVQSILEGIPRVNRAGVQPEVRIGNTW